MWSNQETQRFGFRVHRDIDPPDVWSADEVPGDDSALNIGAGMADDHMNLAAASDGTLYAAIKTSYDTDTDPVIGLLVRRAGGAWDPLYEVDTDGTRPILAISEANDRLVVAYRNSNTSGGIVYRESPLSSIAFGPRRTMMPDLLLNDPSSVKGSFVDQLVVIAAGGGSMAGALLSTYPLINQTPVVDAGPDRWVVQTEPTPLDATVTDDGLPLEPGLATRWTVQSKPAGAVVTFGDSTAVDTTVAFSMTGDYVLRLSADDGLLQSSDDLAITVVAPELVRTATFRQGEAGYKGMIDTRIRADQPDVIFGNSVKLELDGHPDFSSLMRWELGSVPAGVIVLSATITVDTLNTSTDFFELYRVMRPWSENAATFNRPTATEFWEVPGAAGPGDRSSIVMGALTAPNLGPTVVALNPQGLGVVQSWIDAPASNYGLIIQDYTDSTTLDLDISSSEALDISQRPLLTLVYMVAPPVNTEPVANDDGGITLDEDANVAINVLANDTDADGDILTVSAVWPSENGTVTINPDGTVRYAPAPTSTEAIPSATPLPTAEAASAPPPSP